MKTRLIALLLLGAVPSLSNAAVLGDLFVRTTAARTHEYVVSGILKKRGTRNVVKLVQSIENAPSDNEATNSLVRKALVEYPGYSVVSTLASEITVAPSNKLRDNQMRI